MGCNFSNEPVRVIEPQAIEEPKSSAEIEESGTIKKLGNTSIKLELRTTISTINR